MAGATQPAPHSQCAIPGPAMCVALATSHTHPPRNAHPTPVAVQDELDRASAGVLVSAMYTAAPTVGDAEFVAAYNAKVNSRRVTFKHDIIAQLPCEASQGANGAHMPIARALLLPVLVGGTACLDGARTLPALCRCLPLPPCRLRPPTCLALLSMQAACLPAARRARAPCWASWCLGLDLNMTPPPEAPSQAGPTSTQGAWCHLEPGTCQPRCLPGAGRTRLTSVQGGWQALTGRLTRRRPRAAVRPGVCHLPSPWEAMPRARARAPRPPANALGAAVHASCLCVPLIKAAPPRPAPDACS